MQVVIVFQQLILQGLAPHRQRLPVHALLLQLAAQQLGLLFGLGPALLRIAQFAVGIFQGQARQSEFVVHRHALVEQFFEFQAQLFQRRFALFQVEAELFALLVQALGLRFETLQGLAGGIMLGFERAQAHGQLVGVVLVLTGLLTYPIEFFTQGIAAGQQAFALLVVAGHGVESVLQLQARLAQLFLLQFALFGQFQQLAVDTPAAQGQLFDLGLPGGQLRLQLTETAGLLLQLATLLLAQLLLLALAFTQRQ
ncbi:hypothetical protein D3C71_1475230 [compost metagenome]